MARGARKSIPGIKACSGDLRSPWRAALARRSGETRRDSLGRACGRPWRPKGRRYTSNEHSELDSRTPRGRRSRVASKGDRMALKLGIVAFWKNYDRRAVIRAARTAEELGYDSVWIPEAWAYEQFQLLTEIALATSRLKVATGIANLFSRSAGLRAMSAATLDEVSEGRAILGLGTSGKTVVENLHGAPYRKPLTRLTETIGICRALWRGDRLTPELSTLFDARHFKLEMTPRRPTIPIYVASLQEKAIGEIGRLADGWLPTFWPYRHLDDGLALIG